MKRKLKWLFALACTTAGLFVFRDVPEWGYPGGLILAAVGLFLAESHGQDRPDPRYQRDPR